MKQIRFAAAALVLLLVFTCAACAAAPLKSSPMLPGNGQIGTLTLPQPATNPFGTGSLSRPVEPAAPALSDAAQAAYCQLVDAAEARSETVQLTATKLEVMQAIRRFEYEPAHLYLDAWPVVTARADGTSTVTLSYRFGPDESAKRLARCAAAADQLLAGLPAEADDWEAALWVHDALCRRVRFPSEAESDGIDETGELTYSDVYRRLDTVLLRGVAVCQGYAVAYEYLLDRIGIDCDVVVSASHAWNVVVIDGELYHVDVQTDDIGERDTAGQPYITHLFFMVTEHALNGSDLYISRSETPCGTADSEDANYYVRMGWYLDEFDPEAIAEIFRAQKAADCNLLTVRFADSLAYSRLLRGWQADSDEYLEILALAGLDTADYGAVLYDDGLQALCLCAD